MRGPGSRGATDPPSAVGAPARRAGRSSGDVREDRLRDDVAHLVALVEALPRNPGPQRAPGRRPRPDDALAPGRPADEQRLRALTALLMTLDTDLRARADGGGVSRSDDERGPGGGGGARPAGAGPGPELAAAAATYIARDLAARRLTEFTSAEAYRLARALAAVGGVAEHVERTLAEANTIRLHPTPLDRAVSHSAG